jgi:hypothetical protein
MKDQKPTKDLAEVHADFIKREKEAAKDPNHPNHDALKAYFAETERKLAEIKCQKN